MIDSNPASPEIPDHTSCPNCNGRILFEVYPHEHNFLRKCKSCGLVFSSRVPTKALLADHYATYPPYGTLSELTIVRYKELLDQLEPFRKLNRILEIGCGYGFFLEEARKRNWEIFGTEFSDAACQQCISKKIPIAKGTLQPEAFGKIQFDVIVSMEVMEHLDGIDREAGIYYTLLRSGGIIYLTTPNFNSLSRYLLRASWSIINYPEHLTYFCPRTIQSLFNKFGFKTMSLITTGISPGRLLEGIRKIRKGKTHLPFDNTGYNEDQQLRHKIDRNALLKVLLSIVNRLLTFFKAGDTIKVFFIKK